MGEFKKQFTCLRESIEKYITFIVPTQKEVARIDKSGEEIIKNICHILQVIDSARFVLSSLSNLENNISERIHRIKSTFGHDHKKCETWKNVKCETMFSQICKL